MEIGLSPRSFSSVPPPPPLPPSVARSFLPSPKRCPNVETWTLASCLSLPPSLPPSLTTLTSFPRSLLSLPFPPPLGPPVLAKGEMPESLCNLYCLQHLNLSYNSGLRGWIPEGLGDLSNLKTLHLYSALLTGIYGRATCRDLLLLSYPAADCPTCCPVIPAVHPCLCNVRVVHVRLQLCPLINIQHTQSQCSCFILNCIDYLFTGSFYSSVTVTVLLLVLVLVLVLVLCYERGCTFVPNRSSLRNFPLWLKYVLEIADLAVKKPRTMAPSRLVRAPQRRRFFCHYDMTSHHTTRRKTEFGS